MTRFHARRSTTPLVVAGFTLGLGLGGFVDGIVLHQLLQWHHLLSAHEHYAQGTLGDLESLVMWDGVFHSATWVLTALGVGFLWRAGRMEGVAWSPRAFSGALALGWGVFNLVEGVIDHHLLGIHHVRDDLSGPLAWDLGFLAFGALLVLGGWLLIRGGRVEGTPAGG